MCRLGPIMENSPTRIDKWFYIILGALILFNTLRFTVASFTAHASFNTFGFDLGIQHHATWLISRLEDPFSTVNGLHFFAGHARFISILVAPLLWVWEEATALLFLQALMLSLGALPLYLIAREKLNSNVAGILIVISYFLYPALGHLNLENFHYDSLLTPFLLFAFYFLIKGRYLGYFIFVILSLITKEEAAATIFLLGIYAYFQNKKVGIATVVLSVSYVVIILKIIFPLFRPDGYAFYSRLTVAKLLLTDPFSLTTYKDVIEVGAKNLLTERNWDYLLQLFYPVAFLALLSPMTMLLAGSLYINLLSDWSYAHSIKYHYVAMIIPFVFISVVYALALLRSSRLGSKLPCLVVCTGIVILAASVAGNHFHGPNNLKLEALGRLGKNYESAMSKNPEYEEIIRAIPKQATVSANYNLVPHLTQRKVIFQYPNPFVRSYWGLGRDAPYTDVKYVDYVIRDTRRDKEYEEFTQLIENGTYIKASVNGRFVLYKYTGQQGQI